MGDNDAETSDSGEEKCWGIIAINEYGAGYVQAYKEGDPIAAYEFSKPDFLKKDKKKKIKKLVEVINKEKLFVKVNELVLSTTEDCLDQLEALDVLHKKPTHIINLPNESIAPILDTLRLLHIQPPAEASSFKENVAKFEENADSSVPHNRFNWKDNQDLTPAYEDEQKASSPRHGSASSTDSKAEEKIDGLVNDPDENKERDVNSYLIEIILKLDEKIDGLVSAVNGLGTRIQTMETKYILLQKKAPPVIPSKPTITGLPCYFLPPPVQVKQIQIQFSSQLKHKLNKEKLQILDNSSGPTVAFGVNASRLIADIQRDLKSDTSSGPIFLLVIKATMKPEDLAERLDPRSMGFDRVKEAAFLLVDTNNTRLHDCTNNEKSLNSVIQFLKDNKEGTRI